MKVIGYSQYGGFDWHDSKETTEFLKNGDTYDFTGMDEDDVIAEFIHEEMTNMYSTHSDNKEDTTYRLLNIPSLDEIRRMIKDKEKIKVVSEPIQPFSDEYEPYSELEYVYDPENRRVNYSYVGGRYHTAVICL